MCAMCGRSLRMAEQYDVIVRRLETFPDEPTIISETACICRLCAARIMDYLTEQVHGGVVLNAAR